MCNQTDSSSTSSEDNLKPKHEPIDLMSDLKDYVGESKDDFNLEKAYSGLQVSFKIVSIMSVALFLT